jgi:hypothetical protein
LLRVLFLRFDAVPTDSREPKLRPPQLAASFIYSFSFATQSAPGRHDFAVGRTRRCGSRPEERHLPQGPSQVVVRREPSRVRLISIVGRSTFRAGLCTFQSKERVDMRAHRIFLSFAIAMGCGITLQSTAFSQEYRGTWEQQMACTPDVWRLCGAQVPDVDRIVACLRRNTPQLSGRCRAVFEQSDNAPRRGEDRDYGQRRYDRDYGPRPYDRDYGPRPYDDDDE